MGSLASRKKKKLWPFVPDDIAEVGLYGGTAVVLVGNLLREVGADEQGVVACRVAASEHAWGQWCGGV